VLAELRLADGDELPELGSTVTVEAFAKGDVDRRDRHQQGQGLRRCHEAAQLPGMGDGHGVKKKNRHPGAVGCLRHPGPHLQGQRRWPAAWAASA
jgi:large subunit ribosomal protein L3